MDSRIEWENLRSLAHFSTMRAKVFGGWIVLVSGKRAKPSCSIYLNDKEHSWTGTLEKGVVGETIYYNWQKLKLKERGNGPSLYRLSVTDGWIVFVEDDESPDYGNLEFIPDPKREWEVSELKR